MAEFSFIEGLQAILVAAGVAGALYLLVAARAVRRFVSQPPARPDHRPPVTVLKPLCGEEPGLYDNLKSFCDQAYPELQVVCGVRSAADPAVTVVRRLIAEQPDGRLELVIDSRLHGTNFKISNLINMLPQARHEILVISDSDMHAGPDYLDAVVAPFADPGVGLVTCLYRGRSAGGLWSRLGAMFINQGFLASVLVGRLVGAREGCFGATMALHRSTLEQIGGLESLRDRLADDYALGEAVRGLGLKVVMSGHLVDNQVHEPDLATLLRHELRWARTLRSIEPAGYAASIITHPILPAGLALVAGGFAPGLLTVFGLILACRIGFAIAVESALGLPPPPLWLVPVRDLLSVAVLILSFCGTSVTWRNHKFRVEPDGQLTIDGDLPS